MLFELTLIIFFCQAISITGERALVKKLISRLKNRCISVSNFYKKKVLPYIYKHTYFALSPLPVLKLVMTTVSNIQPYMKYVKKYYTVRRLIDQNKGYLAF